MVNAKHQLDKARSLAAQYVDASLHQFLLGFGALLHSRTPSIAAVHRQGLWKLEGQGGNGLNMLYLMIFTPFPSQG